MFPMQPKARARGGRSACAGDRYPIEAMVSGLESGAEVVEATMQCRDCQWTASGSDAEAGRRMVQRARYHARRWGHHTRVVVSVERRYGP